MQLDGARAQEKVGGDLPVRSALGGRQRNLPLALAQDREWSGRALSCLHAGRAKPCPRTGGPWIGSEALERGQCLRQRPS